MKKFLFFLLLFLSVATAASAASIPGGREAWCKLLKLPTLNNKLEVNWDCREGLTLSTDKPDPAIEVPKLKTRLQGGPADAGRLQEAQATAERWGKQKETTRSRLTAAKVCDKLGLAEQAVAHVNRALALEPRGYLPNLMAAVLILKHSKTAETVETARPLLLQAKDGSAASETNAQEYNMTVGIFCVLTGDFEEARKFFRAVLTTDKDHDTAKQALAMLAGK